MTKHTPGPWTCDAQHGTFYVFGHHSAMVADSQDGEESHLARIRGVGRNASMEEQEANARLIASAPDLADALENMLGAFNTPVRRVKLPSDFGDEACKSAEAALRKAGRLAGE